ncbi:hypothetical protein pb186bvf_010711 [Paramecium bursaria]
MTKLFQAHAFCLCRQNFKYKNPQAFTIKSYYQQNQSDQAILFKTFTNVIFSRSQQQQLINSNNTSISLLQYILIKLNRLIDERHQCQANIS